MPGAISHDGNASGTCAMATMAKASVPGQTKTRLVPPLTFDEAARCNTAFLQDAADAIVAASEQASIAAFAAFGPPQLKAFFQNNLPPAIGLIEAWYPTLGECLFSALAEMLDRGYFGAVVLNSDSPTLPVSFLLETVDVLRQPGERIVLGPAVDGGYYLLGVKGKHQHLFEDIAWSTEHVAQQTLSRAEQLDLPAHLLPEWYDVDDLGSLEVLRAELFYGRPFAPGFRAGEARHTRAMMRTLADKLGPRPGRAAE
jgi:uncharacterized protein